MELVLLLPIEQEFLKEAPGKIMHIFWALQQDAFLMKKFLPIMLDSAAQWRVLEVQWKDDKKSTAFEDTTCPILNCKDGAFI